MTDPNDGIPKDGIPKPAGDPIAELEAFIAETEARGEAVPPEAHAMLARIRELMDALRGLTASFEEREKAPDQDEDLH